MYVAGNGRRHTRIVFNYATPLIPSHVGCYVAQPETARTAALDRTLSTVIEAVATPQSAHGVASILNFRWGKVIVICGGKPVTIIKTPSKGPSKCEAFVTSYRTNSRACAMNTAAVTV